MKKLLSLVLSLALAFSLCVPAMAASESMANFQKTATYNNQFSDVSASCWATPSIKLCYEYGFMKGTTPKQFSPTGALTVAEAIVMADRLHEIYTTGQSTLTNGEPWYQTYVDYAIENGIVQSGDFTSYTAKATRGQMAYIFSRALPASVMLPINETLSLPDVTTSTTYANEIFSLYDAGILTGSDNYGTFNPNNNIKRAEAAAILSRVALPEQRQIVVLLKQIQCENNVVLSVPQKSESATIGGVFIAASTENQTEASLISVQDESFRGVSVASLTPAQVNSMVSDIVTGTNAAVTITNMSSKLISFGTLKAYKTDGTLNSESGNAYCTVYSYATGNSMYFIELTAHDKDLLTKMSDGVMVDGHTAKSVSAAATNPGTSTGNVSSGTTGNVTKPSTGSSTGTGGTTGSDGGTTSVTKPAQSTVYVTPTGKRYHYSKDCAGKNGKATTLQNAKARGLTPCQKCVL